MLAYGAAADQCDEITQMRTFIALKCLKKFCRHIEFLYASIACIGSGRTAQLGWARAYSGRKGRPTIILEAVASYDTHIWHTFFGTPGAQNNLNVLGVSNVFECVIVGTAPQVQFEINNKKYNNGYYLADGIYSRWSTFVKTISNPRTEQEKHFCKKQEAYRKDVEQCFGIIQSRWALLRHGARLFKQEDLRAIMISCIILRNMIMEDEFIEEKFMELKEDDLMNPSMENVYDWPVHPDTGEPIQFEPMGRDG